MTVIGRREPRIEDHDLLVGKATYVADLVLAGCGFVGYVRSPVAHGSLRRLDLEAVRVLPGVLGAYGATDLDLVDLPSPVVPGFDGDVGVLGRPLLARDRIRYVGEPVAVVVVDDPSLVEDAVELVQAEYETYQAVVDAERAGTGDVTLYRDVPGNVVARFELGDQSWRADDYPVVVSQKLVNHKVLPAPMEVRGCAACWEDDGRVSIWLSTQAPHLARPSFARVLGVDVSEVHLRPVAVGGGFGAKAFPYPEELLVPLISRLLGRPLKWVETRSESMVSLTAGRGQHTTVTLGADRDGRVGAVEFDVLQDSGAYTGMGTMMPSVGWLVGTGPYAIAKARLRGRSVVTNTTPTGAYRGAGRPEPAYALERMMDLLALELGIDPAEVRRRNLIDPTRYPYVSATGTEYDSGNLPGALRMLLEHAGYEQLRAEQVRRRERGDRERLGIGLSVFVDIAGRLSPPESGTVEVTPAGDVVIKTGSSPHGQGHATVWAMLASERLGLAIDRFTVIYGDTDDVPVGGDTFGSKSLQSAGVVVDRAANLLVHQARDLVAEMLEASADDVVLDVEKAAFYVQGTPAVLVTWAELAQFAYRRGGQLAVTVTTDTASPTFPSGAYLAVVAVDIETGMVRVESMVTCDDAGVIVNPLIAEGQVHGAVVQGIAQALYEEQRYDDDGNPLTTNFADYLIPSACEMPALYGVFQQTPTNRNELGVKGIGESGAIGATPAVVNAVCDALAELGVRHLDMPLSPERVWQAIRSAPCGRPAS